MKLRPRDDRRVGLVCDFYYQYVASRDFVQVLADERYVVRARRLRVPRPTDFGFILMRGEGGEQGSGALRRE